MNHHINCVINTHPQDLLFDWITRVIESTQIKPNYQFIFYLTLLILKYESIIVYIRTLVAQPTNNSNNFIFAINPAFPNVPPPVRVITIIKS
ncbi:hypothetical protein RA876_11240 [Rhodoferax antarcticus]|nr:hypothetical protein RA876_11240 [Rhodoferax antarcticus]